MDIKDLAEFKLTVLALSNDTLAKYMFQGDQVPEENQSEWLLRVLDFIR